MRFTTTAPTSGLAASVGESVLYVTGGAATLYYKYGATDTEWCTTPAGGGATPVTTDPRSAGLSATVGSVVLYVPFAGSPALLYKHGSGNTDWCTWDAAVASHVHAMADVTGLVAALAAKPTIGTVLALPFALP